MITRQAGKLWDETGVVDYVAYSLEAWFPVFCCSIRPIDE
jgi:hypothetical protein